MAKDVGRFWGWSWMQTVSGISPLIRNDWVCRSPVRHFFLICSHRQQFVLDFPLCCVDFVQLGLSQIMYAILYYNWRRSVWRLDARGTKFPNLNYKHSGQIRLGNGDSVSMRGVKFNVELVNEVGMRIWILDFRLNLWRSEGPRYLRSGNLPAIYKDSVAKKNLYLDLTSIDN